MYYHWLVIRQRQIFPIKFKITLYIAVHRVHMHLSGFRIRNDYTSVLHQFQVQVGLALLLSVSPEHKKYYCQ